MLFLFGIYKGVEDGSVDYIRENKADLWILQRNSTNILRGTSILPAFQKNIIQKNENVETVAQILILLTTIKKGSEHSTIFLAGYDPEFRLGGPPKILQGRNIRSGNEIVLDKSYAKKNKFHIGDTAVILDDTLLVVGISEGTNAFVIQYAFTTLKEAQLLLGFPNIITCDMIKLKKGSDLNKTAGQLKSLLKGVNIYNYEEFLENNIKEMESGFLPILYAVAGLGAIVLTAVLSLILSINILEKKKEFAVIKILGAPKNFLPKIVFQQAITVISTAGIFSIIFFFPLVSIIENISPEVSTKTTVSQILIVISAGLVMSLISSIVSLRRLRKIYPMEVFNDR